MAEKAVNGLNFENFAVIHVRHSVMPEKHLSLNISNTCIEKHVDGWDQVSVNTNRNFDLLFALAKTEKNAVITALENNALNL